MVSSTAANSLNQHTPRSESQSKKFPLKTDPRVTHGSKPPCALGSQNLVNPGRTQPLLGSPLNSAHGWPLMDR